MAGFWSQMVWKCLECVSRVRCDARIQTRSCPNWTQSVEQRNRHFVRGWLVGWLVGWLLQFIGPMMSWWVMCRICSTSAVVTNKGSSQVSSDIWVNYVNICRLEIELRNTCHVDKLKDTCMRFQNLIEMCYFVDVFFFVKNLIIHPVNSQFSWGNFNRSSFKTWRPFSRLGIFFICCEPVAFRSFQRAGYRWCVFPLGPPLGACSSMPWNEPETKSWTEKV